MSMELLDTSTEILDISTEKLDISTEKLDISTEKMQNIKYLSNICKRIMNSGEYNHSMGWGK